MNMRTNINWEEARSRLSHYTWQQRIINTMLVFSAASACIGLLLLLNKTYMRFLRDYHWSKSLSLSLIYGGGGMCALIGLYVIYSGCKGKPSSLQEILFLTSVLDKAECLAWEWNGENREVFYHSEMKFRESVSVITLKMRKNMMYFFLFSSLVLLGGLVINILTNIESAKFCVDNWGNFFGDPSEINVWNGSLWLSINLGLLSICSIIAVFCFLEDTKNDYPILSEPMLSQSPSPLPDIFVDRKASADCWQEQSKTEGVVALPLGELCSSQLSLDNVESILSSSNLSGNILMMLRRRNIPRELESRDPAVRKHCLSLLRKHGNILYSGHLPCEESFNAVTFSSNLGKVMDRGFSFTNWPLLILKEIIAQEGDLFDYKIFIKQARWHHERFLEEMCETDLRLMDVMMSNDWFAVEMLPKLLDAGTSIHEFNNLFKSYTRVIENDIYMMYSCSTHFTNHRKKQELITEFLPVTALANIIIEYTRIDVVAHSHTIVNQIEICCIISNEKSLGSYDVFFLQALKRKTLEMMALEGEELPKAQKTIILNRLQELHTRFPSRFPLLY